MLEAVIFDMDGVIVDSEPWHLEVNLKLFEELGFELSLEEYKQFIGKSNIDMWSLLKNKYSLKQSMQELLKIQGEKNIQYLQQQKDGLIEGILTLLRTLKEKGIPTGLASSSSLEYIEAVLDKYKIREYFQVVVTGESMEKGKPAPDIFLYTAKLLEAKSENCVVIEDSENGVKAAKAGGMRCIGFKNPNSGEQDLHGADWLIDSIKEIRFEDLIRLFR
mgnify:CR=1 FL=1|jgi:beta-phosphoglucomutase family hydrolase